MSKISKKYFFRKSRFFKKKFKNLVFQQTCAKRCQGSKVVYTIYLPHCGRESISEVDTWPPTIMSLLHMDFTCFSGGHRFRHFLLTRSSYYDLPVLLHHLSANHMSSREHAIEDTFFTSYFLTQGRPPTFSILQNVSAST